MITPYSSGKAKAEASYFDWVKMYFKELFSPDNEWRSTFIETLQYVGSLLVYLGILITSPVSVPILAFIAMKSHRNAWENSK